MVGLKYVDTLGLVEIKGWLKSDYGRIEIKQIRWKQVCETAS